MSNQMHYAKAWVTGTEMKMTILGTRENLPEEEM